MSHVDDGTVHAYLDGELTPAERAQLEAHVAECVTCRTRLADERALADRAGQLLGYAQPVERPAPPLHQLRPPRLVWRVRVPLAWAATVLVAVGLGYYAGGAGRDFESPPAPAQVAASPAMDSFGTAQQIARLQDRLAQQPSAPKTPAAPPPERRRANVAAAREEDAAAPNARADSIAVTSGLVASAPRPALREVTPTPVPSEAVITTRPTADLGYAGARAVTTEWAIIRPGPARELLGADPVGVPGLTVRNMRRSPTGDVVLVEQAVDSETVIQVFQRRMEEERQAPAPSAMLRQRAAATERLARYVGKLRVEIAGPLTADSLNRLLEQVKPIKP